MDVIIPTKNSEFHLDSCLDALANQSVEVRVIVVDGHSEDKTRIIARKYGADVYLEPPRHRVRGSGRAVACNEGLRGSSSDIVGFIDSDTVVPPNWARDLTKYFSDKSVGAITSGCLSKDKSLLGMAINQVMQIGSTHARNFRKVTVIDSAPGYNAVYRRSVIDSVGGFNEKIGGSEDWELNYRIRKGGWKVVGVPESPVEHRERRTLKAFAKQMYGYAWSWGRLLKTTHIFMPLQALPSLALIMLFPTLFALGVFDNVYNFSLFIFTTMFVTLVLWRAVLVLFIFLVHMLSWAIGYIMGLIQ